MKKMFRDLGLSIAMALGAVVLLTGVIVLMTHVIPVPAQAGVVEQADEMPVNQEVKFDTSVLQTWCHGEDLGTVRMVGAWVHEREGDVWTLYDETGNAWTVEDLHNMEEHGWMLLWIADNNTVDDVTDDIIVKTWVEVY